MSRNANGGGSGNGASLFAGILLGMVLGLATAGGVAWYILKKNPASFESKEHHEAVKPEAENKLASPAVTKPVPVPASAPIAASGVAEPKQHFEFYKVLTDKPDATTQKNAAKPKEALLAPTPPQPKFTQPAANAKEIFYVQAGSFPNRDDAEKLKAKLALLGMEATLQIAAIPDKGTFHRVRLGPFTGGDELNKTLALLKQNGVNATPIKTQ